MLVGDAPDRVRRDAFGAGAWRSVRGRTRVCAQRWSARRGATRFGARERLDSATAHDAHGTRLGHVDGAVARDCDARRVQQVRLRRRTVAPPENAASSSAVPARIASTRAAATT
ncbi:MAG: hypothetical protein IT379_22785 [Deltaproteobacteria bacterium]|nr:hypothetical protein [Deltaproteobacteria bacterium]